MKQAYPNRKRFAPTITTPQMDMLVEKALANGAEARKCAAQAAAAASRFCVRRTTRDVEARSRRRRREVLDWKLAREGLYVKKV
jgi:hypothetical protein